MDVEQGSGTGSDHPHHQHHPVVDHRLIGAIHVDRLRKQGLSADAHHDHLVFQTSTLAALLDGRYEGDVTIGDLRAHGTFGVGTVQHLDGEMVALDGVFYQLRSDGSAHVLPNDTRSPFAVVTFFQADLATRVPEPAPGQQPRSLESFQQWVDTLAPPDAACYAIRFDGLLPSVLVRSVPRQTPPYPPLSAVVQEQTTFTFHDFPGTLVGFRFPAALQGLTVPGYHWHVLSADRQRGGHVLSAQVGPGTLSLAHSTDLHVETPPGVHLPPLSTDQEQLRLIHDVEG